MLYSPHEVRRMAKYIYQRKEWPTFDWDQARLAPLLATTHRRLGHLMSRMEEMGLHSLEEAQLRILTLDVIKNSEIENEILDLDQVRSSIARKLNIDAGGLIPSDRYVEGTVEMMLDATQNYEQPLTQERLSNWHAALFPTSRSGIHPIITGDWRTDNQGPMQVISGPYGNQRVHYQAPSADKIEHEIKTFLSWFNKEQHIDPLIKAAIAHLWFVTIHPFEDGNGRIARTIADMQLARADKSSQRFYSMSAQIRKERKAYYTILEKTQKSTLDITGWLEWFLNCINHALAETENTLSDILRRAHFWKMHIDSHFNERQRFMLNKLLDDFFGNLTSSKWAKLTKCSQDTATRDIQDLINRGILRKESAGGRSTSYSLTIQ